MALKLDFRQVKFCGREDELGALQKAYNGITDPENPVASTVILEGVSGSGKSSLVLAFWKKNQESRLCMGKFQEGKTATDPFAAVIQACEAVIRQLKPQKELWKTRLRENLSSSDIEILSPLVPSLKDLVEEDNNKKRSGGSVCSAKAAQGTNAFERTQKEWSFDLLRFSLRSLLRVVSLYVPVILFLDDLQWAGEDSLMLLQTIICDKMSGRRLLFIGSHRPVGANHPLVDLILSRPWCPTPQQELRKWGSESVNIPWTVIKLVNLSATEVTSMVASVLEADDATKVESLGSVVHRKTKGNPFFVLQFLWSLEDKDLVYYSTEEERWAWKSDVLESKTDIADSVVEVILERLRALPQVQQGALSTAACLGSLQLDVRTMKIAMGLPEHFGNNMVASTLNALTDAGYLFCEKKASTSSEVYRFVHDRIREGSYALLTSTEERMITHLSIGRRLQAAYGKRPEADETLLMVSQLNIGAPLMQDISERLQLAELNYRSAAIAVSGSAFFPAAAYLGMGIKFVCHDSKEAAWADQYELILKLSIAKARIEYCCDRCDESIAFADDVIEHAKIVDEKQLAYNTKILCLESGLKAVEGCDLALKVMKEYGAPFPSKFQLLHGIRQLLKTKRMLRSYEDRDLLSISATKDLMADKVAEFLTKILFLNFSSPKPNGNLSLLGVLRTLKMSLNDGRCQITGFGFVLYGAILVKLGDLQNAARYGTVGLRIAQKDGHHLARATFLYHFFVSHWLRPAHTCLEPLLGFKWSPEAADYFGVYFSAAFSVGRPLDLLEKDARQVSSALEDYKKSVTLEMCLPLFQANHNLQGESNDPLVLSGYFMDEKDFLKNCKAARALQYILLNKLKVAVILGDWNVASDISLKVLMADEKLLKQPDITTWFLLTFGGLPWLALARTDQLNRASHAKKAKGFIQRLKKWASKGSIVCKAMHTFLLAEESAKNAKTEVVLALFDECIADVTSWSDTFYYNIRALVNERAGVFCLERNLDASKYLICAMELYREWKAWAKVLQLEKLYPQLFSVKESAPV